MILIAPSRLSDAYDSLDRFVSEQDGNSFNGFHTGYVSREEGYKAPLAIAAREALQLATWRPDLIGTGHLKQAVLRAIAVRVPWVGKTLPNNLVHWQQVQPFQELPNAAVEQAIHDLFRSSEAPSAIYERLRDAGVSYQIAAFLFFVKEPEVYLPITQQRFDQAFRLLGVQGFKTWGAKGWDNYATYLDLIGQVRAYLTTKLTTPVSLLDAHSFVYMIASQMQRGERNKAKVEKLVASFQATWPLARVRTMSLEEYAQAPGNKDSFCYWVKERMKEAGSLGNTFPANTFGIYRRDPKNTDGKTGLAEEGGYLWLPSLGGDTAQEAFEAMRDRIVATIEAAQAGDLAAISQIHGFDLFRWKLAYLYAPDKVVPIYNREHLKAAARELGMPNYQQASYAARHRYILANLPEGMDAFTYMHDFYERNRVEPERGVKYWVVGSSYQDPGQPSTNVFDRMVEQGGVSIGYLWGEDLTAYYLDATRDVGGLAEEYYKTHRTESAKAARDAMRHFMQIAPGDIVAIKGSKYVHDGVISIIGYARIVERDGVVYRPSTEGYPDGLGHILNAEFLATDLERRIPVMRGASVHLVDRNKDRSAWDHIFGPLVAQLEGVEHVTEQLALADELDAGSPPHGGTAQKNVTPHFRKGSIGREVEQYHNQMQQSYYDLLHTLHAGEDIRMERGYVDIVRVDAEGVHHLYEVKPDAEPLKCIRQGIGQLLAYAWSYGLDNARVRLYVVGPQPIDERGRKFLGFVQDQLGMALAYMDHQPTAAPSV